jgi:hypothetical protein
MIDYRRSQYEHGGLFRSLGFDENPFASTNADEEERLPDYFVPPAYFPSVFGDPTRPSSFFVFAPRGGGKSAQRRMIESKCAQEQVLSITYDRFEFPGITKASEVTLSAHLQRIIQRCLMGLLVALNADPALASNLSKHERELLVRLAGHHLKGMNAEKLQATLDSLKSLKHKVQDFWNEWLPVIGPALNVLLQKLTGVDIDQLGSYDTVAPQGGFSQKFDLSQAVELAHKLGFRSVYVLIDRVDEAELTGNDALASFQLIEPLVRDLELLELRGIAFKFFLWDRLETPYLDTARTDRVRHETLSWDDPMLSDMWRKRLSVYSDGRVESLDAIAEELPAYSLDALALIFANHSPRDMVRIGAQVLAEQQEIDAASTTIRQAAIVRGIDKFCALRSRELLTTRTLSDLRKVRQVDFTISYLAGEVFREQQTNTRNRISRWRREGAVDDIDRIDNPKSDQARQVKLFAVLDVRVAREIMSGSSLLAFLDSKYKRCPTCGNAVIRDWGERDTVSWCDTCQFDLGGEAKADSWEVWRRREHAAEVWRERRRLQIEQQSLFDMDELGAEEPESTVSAADGVTGEEGPSDLATPISSEDWS